MDKLDNYISLFNRSPLRNTSSGIDFLISLFQDETEQLMKDAELIIERSVEPLNVVVMGEVKAGKSSLINAILQDDVSPTDVTEATSCIIDISFCATSSASLLIDGKTVRTGSPKEVISLYAAKNIEHLEKNQLAEIHLCLNSGELKNLHLVDTPGLETINDAYQNTTINYFQSSDVIIWVFNANHIGQSDVRERLSSVARLGKPMIGVVNRIDETEEGETESIINYFRNNYSIYLERIFGVSALWARQGFSDKNDNLLQSSGITQLMGYLAKVDERVKQVKQASTLSSMHALVFKDKALHDLAKNKVIHDVNQLDLFKNKCNYHKDAISRKLKVMTEEWLDNRFLAEEEEQVLSTIEESINAAQIDSMLKNAVSNNNINRRLEDLSSLVKINFTEEWKRAIEDISLELMKADELHLEFQKKIIADIQSENITVPELLIDGVKKGATIGGALGLVGGSLVIATTAVTLPALIVFIPVYALVGMLTGGIVNLFGVSKKKDKMKKEAVKQFHKARADFSNHYKSDFESNLNKVMDSTVIELINRFSVTSNIPSQESLLKHKASLTEYLKSIDSIILSDGSAARS